MEKTSRRNWAALSIALFHTCPIAINQFAPNIIESLGISISMAELILSLNSITATIFLILSGSINEKFGMRKSTIWGLGLVAISGIIPYIFRNKLSIILNRLILGTGIGIYAANSSTYISIFNTGNKKAKILGYRNAFEMIGLILAIFIAGLWGKNDFYNSFAVYTLALIPLLFFMISVPEIKLDSKEDNSKFKTNKIIKYYIVLSLFIIMSTNAMNLRFPSVLANNGVLGESISLYTMGIMFIGMVGGFGFGWVFKIFKDKTLKFSTLMVIIGSLIISITDKSIVLLVLGVGLATFFQSIIISYLVGDLENHMSKKHIAKTTGIMFAANNLGMLIAPLILAGIKNLTGITSLTGVFVGIAAILEVFLIYEVFFLKNNKKNYGRKLYEKIIFS